MSYILLVFAFVISVIGTFAYYPANTNGPFFGRFNLVSMALAFYFLSILVSTFPMHGFGR
jgi:multidrug transporter EmrE-like cation transporter